MKSGKLPEGWLSEESHSVTRRRRNGCRGRRGKAGTGGSLTKSRVATAEAKRYKELSFSLGFLLDVQSVKSVLRAGDIQ